MDEKYETFLLICYKNCYQWWLLFIDIINVFKSDKQLSQKRAPWLSFLKSWLS
jgi:hypothetical protein